MTILNRTTNDRSPYWDNNGSLIHEHVSLPAIPPDEGGVPYGELCSMFMNGRARGPESSKLVDIGMRIMMGFHRLAINGLNPESGQPISLGDVHLICNGEIYNYKELYRFLGVEPTTQSDCEVIVHLYKRYGFREAISMLDGVFSLCLLDQSVYLEHPTVYFARDPFGVRPLYTTFPATSSPYSVMFETREFAFASELKMMYSGTVGAPGGNGRRKPIGGISPRHFPPGTFSEFYLTHGVSPFWKLRRNEEVYYHPGASFFQYPSLSPVSLDVAGIRTALIRAVEKRCECTERPVACLLSGGLDSSLVTAIVSRFRSQRGLPPVETYSIGMEGSEDLRYARIVAEYIGTRHTEIQLSETDFLSAIPAVIEAIESYDTTTVRASIGNFLLGKYIAEHSEAKVIFNGDGSDELMGGYLYMRACPDALEFDRETRRLLREIHAYDVLRSDKCISSHGLEPRTPFLDREFVQSYLSIPVSTRFEPLQRGEIEKKWLRMAFDTPVAFLPPEILWRKKEAFSDGVSKHERSLFRVIREYVDRLSISPFTRESPASPTFPKTKEQIYYREIFDALYPGAHILNHYWMPKYVHADDASARTLELYTLSPQPSSG